MTEPTSWDGLILNVSNRCNLRCPFCYEHGNRVDRQPSLETVREIVSEPREVPLGTLMYMGAETFLRPDLAELIRLGREHGIPHVGVATNGTLLRKRAQVEPLLRAGLNHLELSIHSFDADHAATLSGRSFTHDRQLRALDLLHELVVEFPLTLTINTVLCALNLADVLPLIETLERDYPRLAPMVHLKYPYSVADLGDRVEPASHDALRASDVVTSLPEALRPRVVYEHVPLCVLAPHYAQSCELIGVALDNDTEYHLTLPTLQRGDQGFAVGRPCEFAAVCDTCSVQTLCAGLAPGYLARLGEPVGCRPVQESPAAVLAQVHDFRQDHGLETGLTLTDATVVEGVLARASQALPWRLRSVEQQTETSTSKAPSGPKAPPFAAVLDTYRRDYGALTPRVGELIALRAGLQSELRLPIPDGDAGQQRVAQARDFATRAALRLEEVRSPRRRQVIFFARTQSPDRQVNPAQRAFGRPPACCAAAAKRGQNSSLPERLWPLLADVIHASWLMNPFLWSTPFQLFRHLPCSLCCEATRDRASALYEALGQHNPQLQEHVRRFRTASVFYPDDSGRVFLFDEPCLGERIGYHAVYPGMAGGGSAPSALYTELGEALAGGDGLILAGNTLTVRRGQRLVARFTRPADRRWKLLNFI